MQQVKMILVFFWNKLRLSKPWNAKVPFLISLLYFLILLGTIPHNKAIFSFLASIILITGIAGLGYILNDLGDRSIDASIKKQNAIASLSSVQITLLVIFFLLLIIVPWFYLPFNFTSVLLLSTELLLFYMYALPPFRLKEKTWLGVVCDSFYAHLLPASLATYTYALLSETTIINLNIFVVFLLLWQFFLGLRNIIFHQIQDHENDKMTYSKTLVVDLGIGAAIKLVNRIIVFEVLTFVAFCLILFVCFELKIYLISFFVYLFFKCFQFKLQLKEMDYRAKAYLFLDDFYIQWLPLLSLFLMFKLNTLYVLICLLHLVLFKNEIKRKFVDFCKNIVH